MVNLKKGVFCLIMLYLYSCFGSVTPTKEGTLEIGVFDWQAKRYFRKKINPENIGIDTDAIYKQEPHEYYKNVTYETVDKDHNIYSRFFKNGYFHYFYDKNKILDNVVFNPDIIQIGFVMKVREKLYLVTYAPSDGGRLYKTKIKVKGDTIAIVENYSDSKPIDYMVKIDAPKEWLKWKPDY